MQPIKIIGMGRYLPRRVVANAEIEALMGIPEGAIDRTQAGVKERRWVDEETGSWMAAEAAKEALDRAGLTAKELDLIINASGTAEQAIPDGGPLIQGHLGLGSSGIPALSVHATCLSFMVGLRTAAMYLATGEHKKILVATGDISSCGINPKHFETFPLFGDAAAAAVVTAPDQGEHCGLDRYLFRTYGEGAYHTAIMGAGTKNHPNAPHTKADDNFFTMDAQEVYRMAVGHGVEILEDLREGLSKDLGDIKVVVPHQASGLALQALEHLGWQSEKIATTLERLGNCVAASIPATLYEVVRDDRVSRGDQILFVGTGAGLSICAALLTY